VTSRDADWTQHQFQRQGSKFQLHAAPAAQWWVSLDAVLQWEQCEQWEQQEQGV
jgi:hypothetical protein